jgi:hypothetical protein
MAVRFKTVQKYNMYDELKSIRKIPERGNIDNPDILIHDRSFSGLGTGTSMKSGRIK